MNETKVDRKKKPMDNVGRRKFDVVFCCRLTALSVVLDIRNNYTRVPVEPVDYLD